MDGKVCAEERLVNRTKRSHTALVGGNMLTKYASKVLLLEKRNE